MKKFFTALCALAIIACSLLFVQCKNAGQQSVSVANSNDTSFVGNGRQLPIAYINTDTLLQKYNYAQDLQKKLLDKAENDRANINSRAASLRKEQEEFQRKYQNNAFLSPERAQQEYQRLEKKAADLQEYAQRLDNENMLEQQKMLMQMNDSINTFIKEYNQEKKYEAIFNNASTLYINPAYDITNEVVELLNKRYDAAKK